MSRNGEAIGDPLVTEFQANPSQRLGDEGTDRRGKIRRPILRMSTIQRDGALHILKLANFCQHRGELSCILAIAGE